MDLAGLTEGYRALRETAAVLDLSGRGRIRVTGEDRVRLLHAMTTNHVQQLAPGQGCYALFLTAQGRVLADVNLLAQPEFILLDTEPETREKVYAHLDKYIIADDVALEDLAGSMGCVGLEGPKSRELLGALGAPAPEASHQTSGWGDRLVSRISAIGADGYRIFLPAADAPALMEQLRRHGAAPAADADIRTVRLENGRPRYGEDIGERFIPNETQLFHALHFSKGCYLGQEIVERVRSRGQVHRLLMPLRIETRVPPAPGAELQVQGVKAGEIASAAFSPALDMVVALGYVRDAHARPGASLECNGAPVTVAAARPV
ncbi:MAG: folate-binding protein YgfZ [Bryobacteraceae bacterium]|nr:folate-binding protein YgfZ [Bryobacteraceae bacterium]